MLELDTGLKPRQARLVRRQVRRLALTCLQGPEEQYIEIRPQEDKEAAIVDQILRLVLRLTRPAVVAVTPSETVARPWLVIDMKVIVEVAIEIAAVPTLRPRLTVLHSKVFVRGLREAGPSRPRQ